MAITRIKNNQITDSTIVASSKLSDYSITAGKLANNITYGSDWTITGNLTVNGTTTTVDTNNMTVDDPLLLLGSNQTGSGAVDIGFIGERGDDTNVAFIFDESADEFAVALTSTADANTTITITDYADLHAGGITADDAISATGNVTGGNLTTAGDVTTATVTASSTVTATGNVAGGNLTTAGAVDATGAISSGSTITATGNVSGGNIVTAGDVTTATVTTSGEATLASAIVSDLTSGRVVLAGTGGAIEDSTNLTFNGSTLGVTGAITASTTVTATGNVAGGNITTGGAVDATGAISSGSTIDATGTITGGNFSTGGTATATGNITGGNLITAGAVESATLTTTGDAEVGGGLTVTGNLTVQGTTTTVESTTTTIEDPVFRLGTAGLSSEDSKDRGIEFLHYDGSAKTGFFGMDDTDGKFMFIPDATNTSEAFSGTLGDVKFGAGSFSTTVDATGNITGGNLITSAAVESATVTASSTVTATGNITGGNLITAGATETATITTSGEATLASAIVSDLTSGRVVLAGTSGAIEDSTNLTFNGSTLGVTGAITASTTIAGTGNVTGGNIVTAGDVTTATVTASSTITATGNVTGGNLITGGDADITGDVSAATATISGNVSGGNISISGSGDVQTSLIVGDVFANITTGATLEVAATDSLLLPVGNSAQRPGTPVTGMVRFNSQIDQLEFYDSDSWTTAGSEFTVIASQTFNGDGSTVAFTLSEAQTTASCIVSINGVVQLPTTAYGVSSTTLTFTEAPLSGDVIEVRKLTTTSTVASLVSADASAAIDVADGGTVTVTGITTFGSDILNGQADGVGNIGNATTGFNTVFAKATSAQYADLAEMYAADADIEPGTVVIFGGDAEVTVATEADDHRVAGVISTNPSYLMNSQIDAEHAVAVAFTGRVPTKVTGSVAKGDLMVSAGEGKAKANNNPAPGTVIGKALENSEGDATIEVVIGRF